MWAASIKESLNLEVGGVVFWLPWAPAAVHSQSSTKQPLPRPSPASSSAWLRKAAGQLCVEQHCLDFHDGKGKGKHPQSCKGTWQSLRNMGHQLWQPAGSEMPLFMPHHGNQLLPPQQLLSSSGAPTFPRSWNRGLLYAGSLVKGWQSTWGHGQPPMMVAIWWYRLQCHTSNGLFTWEAFL